MPNSVKIRISLGWVIHGHALMSNSTIEVFNFKITNTFLNFFKNCPLKVNCDVVHYHLVQGADSGYTFTPTCKCIIR